MKGLVFDNELHYRTDLPKPAVPAGEALIRVLVAGVCNTDIEITRGYMGFSGIPGHEFVGVVEEINDAGKHLLGKRVVGEINCACGSAGCEYCSQGLGRHCPNRTTLGIFQRDGCLAEYLTLPLENLLEVPDHVSNEEAVLAEPLAAGFEILEQLDIQPRHEVLIVGDGKLGLLINHAISTSGASVTHVGKHADKLKLLESLGGKTLLLQQGTDFLGQQYDIVVEATGSISGFQFSVRHTKPRGFLVLKSTLASDQQIDLSPVVVNEITIVGSRCGLFRPALEYIAGGADLKPLITATYPADKAVEAVEHSMRKGTLKVLIDFSV
ncbi:MAG: alcohol dehydrogenase catalytic domain-containing protein [Bacteroidales bacterium]|nr:alcohol dehydrogenase catalytic domain-containing protein [Bacteroidales bacterium]